jgi:hypothetical protein
MDTNQAIHNPRFIVFGEVSKSLTSHDNEVRMVKVLSPSGKKSIAAESHRGCGLIGTAVFPHLHTTKRSPPFTPAVLLLIS